MNENYPIIVKTYSLTLWYIEKLAKLPRNHRFTLGEKVQQSLLDLLMLLSDAIYSKNKNPILQEANKELEKLRILSRLMKDLNLLPRDSYRFVSSSIDEIGKMLGGWVKP
jgi:mRNA-degrading endonuclease RelE of RelBE toxin-antitoxin system